MSSEPIAMELDTEEAVEAESAAAVVVEPSAVGSPHSARPSVDVIEPVPAISKMATDSLGTPRLVIQKLVLENFKSYAGRQEIGPFHSRFSAIVGPNGSGKSNVIDALLFVFGYRASKIRLKKLSELVHKSDARKDCEQAKVTIHFAEIRDKDAADAGSSEEHSFRTVPGSDFTVSRVTSTKSASRYLFNGRFVQRQVVVDKLKSKGVDLTHNRFLILQGEVEAISQMKPKGVGSDEGMLEYLEDIIGSNEYLPKIVAAKEKVDALSDETTTKLNRVKAIERDRDSLSDSKNEAMSLVRSEMRIFKAEAVLKQLQSQKRQKEIVQIETEVGGTRELIDELKKGKEQCRTQLTEIDGEFQTLKTGRKALEKKLKKDEKKWKDLEKRDAELTASYNHAKKEAKKSAQSLQKLERAVETAKKKIADNASQLPSLQKRVTELESEHREAEERYTEMVAEIGESVAPLKTKLEQKQKELMPFAERESEINAETDAVKAAIESIEDRYEEQRKKYSALITRSKDLELKCTAKSAEKQQHSEALVRYQQENVEVLKEIQELDSEKHAVRKELEEVSRTLDAKGAIFKQFQQRTGVCKTIMDAQSDGKLSGILGRLGDLGSVARNLDVAASTAGGALNNIVCDTTAHAQRAVEYLKRYKLGRATFICLDQMTRKFGGHCQVDTDPQSRRLFDQIQTDDRFRPCFYHCFHDTLFAKDLAEAKDMAYGGRKRRRVVTLTGNLIETSGMLVGGGRPRNGAIRLSDGRAPAGGSAVVTQTVTRREMDELQQQCTHLNNRVHDLNRQKNVAENRGRTLQTTISSTKGIIRRTEAALKDLEQRVRQTKRRLPKGAESAEELTAVSDEDSRELSRLQSEFESFEAQLKEVTDGSSQLKEEIEALESQILEEGGAETQAQKQAADALKSELAKTKKKITRGKVETTRCRKKTEASAEKLEKLRADKKKFGAEKEELKTSREDLEFKASEVMNDKENGANELKRSDLRFKELETNVGKLESELEEKQTKIIEAKESVKEKEERIVHLRNVLEKSKEHIEGLRRQYEKYTRDFLSFEKVVAVGDEDLASGRMDADGHNGDDDSVEAEMKGGYVMDCKQPLRELSAEELQQIASGQLTEMLVGFRTQADTLQKTVNLTAIATWRTKDAEYLRRADDLKALKVERDEVRGSYEVLKRKRHAVFMEGFSVITQKLKEKYRMLTLGGDAELELVDSIDPFSEGVVLSVRPPKKSWKVISNLSGGEKTLSSMALVFALHHFRPTPLYFMDEIDAALDFKNVSIVANYIQKRTMANAQFIIISLRNDMFERAHRLIGIYKRKDCSKSITIDPHRFQLTAAAVASASVARVPPQVAATGDKSMSSYPRGGLLEDTEILEDPLPDDA